MHLTSPGAASSPGYLKWAAQLPGPQIMPCALASAERPGAGLGFQASARTLAKLNLVSPQLFPLPACCQPAHRDPPADGGLGSDPDAESLNPGSPVAEHTASVASATAAPDATMVATDVPPAESPTAAEAVHGKLPAADAADAAADGLLSDSPAAAEVPAEKMADAAAAAEGMLSDSPAAVAEQTGRGERQKHKAGDAFFSGRMLLSVDCAGGGAATVSYDACPAPLDAGESPRQTQEDPNTLIYGAKGC